MQLETNMPTQIPKSYEEYKADQKARVEKNNEMGQQEFLNLLIVQMQNQDPLKPMENAEFMQQTATFSQLEQSIKMNQSMTSLLDLMSKNVTTDNNLGVAANFIGKTIEYNTNTLTISDSGEASNISFYASSAATNANVNIYNSNKELVGTVKLSDIKKGSNGFVWNGKSSAGTDLPAGAYTFTVSATDSSGKSVNVGTYSEAQVLGVKQSGGVIYYEVANGLVPADTVYSVKNTTTTK